MCTYIIQYRRRREFEIDLVSKKKCINEQKEEGVYFEVSRN